MQCNAMFIQVVVVVVAIVILAAAVVAAAGDFSVVRIIHHLQKEDSRN